MSPEPYRIAIEGIDGVGKSTVIRRVAERLAGSVSVSVESMAPVMLRVLRSFGRARFGAEERYWTEVSRRTKSQVFLTEGVVRPHYLAEKYADIDVVLYDRWWETFLAYSDDPTDFDTRCRFLRDNLPSVDATVYLRGDPGVSAKRLRADDDWLVRQMPEEALVPFLTELGSRYDAVMHGRPDVTMIEVADLAPEDIAEHIISLLPGAKRAHRSCSSPQMSRRGLRSIFAIEGIDGSGKSTVASAVAAARCDISVTHRLASASLDLFKRCVHLEEGEQASTAIRREYEDEFRQQTYLIDGLVQLDCLRESDVGLALLLFDRWFPLFALFQHQIVSDRPLFDHMLSLFPEPDRIFYLDVDARTAADRLALRDDWMLELLGRIGTESALQEMLNRQLTELASAHARVLVLDGRQALDALVKRIASEIPT